MAVSYSEQAVAVAVEAALSGGTDQEIAQAIGCSRSTFNRWLIRYPEFRDKIVDARMPEGQAATLKQLKQRKTWANDWLDDYLRTKGEMTEVSITYVDENGAERTEKKARGKMPDLRLIDRILGVSSTPERFELTISVAEPPPDLDDEDWDDDELDAALSNLEIQPVSSLGC